MTEKRRYWVNVPLGIPEDQEAVPEENREKFKEIDTELKGAGFLQEETKWVFKTWDKEEALAMARKGQELWKGSPAPDVADAISISTQPICPKCGELGRFSDEHCSKCSAELLPKALVDVDSGEIEGI